MPATRLKQVLFLDDDPEFLESLQTMFAPWAENRWSMFLTHDLAYSLVVLRENTLDLVVVDLNMPLVDGLQFLKLLHQVCPGPRKVVLTGVADDEYREACLQRGASLYLLKPSSVTSFKYIFRLLDEVMESFAAPGFSGVLRRVALADLIQLLCMTRSSTVLHVHADTVQGCIYIRDGRVLHAETDENRGLDAFFTLVNLKAGGFDLKPYAEPAGVTIQGSCDGLLLDAAQRQDERESPSDAAGGATAPVAESGAPLFSDDRSVSGGSLGSVAGLPEAMATSY
jgi:CheY-like chemotaxis protein